MAPNRRIGILGGAFDPPHLGHANAAKNVLASGIVDEIWFMPASDARYDKSPVASEYHRVQMLNCLLREILQGDPRVQVSTYQFNPSLTTSTTIDLMDSLKNEYPEKTFVFLIGEDNVVHLSNWRESERLLRENTIVVIPRKGTPTSPLPKGVQFIKSDKNLENDLSSTSVRDLLATGKPTTGILPKSIEEYVHSNRLYSNPS